MMSAPQQFLKRCVMCGSGDIGSEQVTYKRGTTEVVPVCHDCGYHHFSDSRYAYVVYGLPEYIGAEIAAILKRYVPDSENVRVEVAELG